MFLSYFIYVCVYFFFTVYMLYLWADTKENFTVAAFGDGIRRGPVTENKRKTCFMIHFLVAFDFLKI